MPSLFSSASAQYLPFFATKRSRYRPQHFLNFLPLPQGHGSLRPAPEPAFYAAAQAAQGRRAGKAGGLQLVTVAKAQWGQLGGIPILLATA
jgi:hypothetical protein